MSLISAKIMILFAMIKRCIISRSTSISAFTRVRFSLSVLSLGIMQIRSILCCDWMLQPSKYPVYGWLLWLSLATSGIIDLYWFSIFGFQFWFGKMIGFHYGVVRSGVESAVLFSKWDFTSDSSTLTLSPTKAGIFTQGCRRESTFRLGSQKVLQVFCVGRACSNWWSLRMRKKHKTGLEWKIWMFLYKRMMSRMDWGHFFELFWSKFALCFRLFIPRVFWWDSINSVFAFFAGQSFQDE